MNHHAILDTLEQGAYHFYGARGGQQEEQHAIEGGVDKDFFVSCIHMVLSDIINST